jgi:serine/threonine-protein kinase
MSRQAIQTQLKDPNKLIRQAALNALAKMDGPIAVGPVCQLLRDPDLEVANRAIDVVVRAKDPDTMKYLVEVPEGRETSTPRVPRSKC